MSITEPGCYLLKSNLILKEAGKDAISVKANNVTIDFNGHSIKGAQNKYSTSNGIYGNSVSNVVVKNGTIDGFFYGIRFDGESNGSRSSNISIYETNIINSYFRGISVEATRAVLNGNKIIRTGGTEVFTDAFSIAIEVKGASCKISNNHIEGIFPSGIGEGVGISLSNNRSNCHVANNNIISGISGGGTFGIWLVNENTSTLLEQNHVVDFIFPFSVATKATKIIKNISKNSKCSPLNHATYFRGLSKSNKFIGKKTTCPILIDSRRESYLKNRHDPRVIFQFAVSKYFCSHEPRLSDEACCRNQKEALLLYEEAARLGLAESKRVLPVIKNVVKNSSVCLSSRRTKTRK